MDRLVLRPAQVSASHHHTHVFHLYLLGLELLPSTPCGCFSSETRKAAMRKQR